MRTNTESPRKSVERLRLIARILSGMIIGITLILLFGHIFFPEPTIEDYPWVENLLPVMMAVSVIGLVLAFRWEYLGGGLCLGLFLLQLLQYWMIRGHFFSIRRLLVFSPLPLTALLFIYLGRGNRIRPIH